MGAIVGTAELIGFYSINFFVAKIKRRVTNMIGFSVSILACFGFLFYGVTAASA